MNRGNDHSNGFVLSTDLPDADYDAGSGNLGTRLPFIMTPGVL